ncbi:MAG: GTPase HflX [Spirochaetes bacterium]|nr:GTPase HflX [Spirochaetota bacterium]
MDASVNRIPVSPDERALLVALKIGAQRQEEVRESLEELKLLVKTAGALVVDALVFSRESPDPASAVGKGQLEQVRALVGSKDIRLVVFDLNSMKPNQVRNLEETLKCRVLGRTEIILDIFARRARSAESKIQVELAQLRYTLPRLKGLGGVLSRLGGGIGTRGPGEKMIETDRRHILRRITVLKKKLEKITRHRRLVRTSRSGQVLGAVVGYTNAGKSTLINLLARDDLFVEDRLFATLDAYTRSVFLDDERKVLLTDTVGFIRNLPANLVESFNSTLEEISGADFIIHVVDSCSSDIEGSIETVNRELASLESLRKPVLLFFNKMDAVRDMDSVRRAMAGHQGAVSGSSLRGDGIDVLKAELMRLHDEFASPERIRC